MRFWLLALGLTLSMGLLTADPAEAKKKKKRVYWYQYAVVFTCGSNTTDAARIPLGDYSAQMTIANLDAIDASVLQRVAVSYPLPGVVTNELPGTVSAGTAQELSCQDALDLGAVLPPGSPTYAQGIAVIDSNKPLQITVTRSVTTPGGQTSMETTPVPARLIPQR